MPLPPFARPMRGAAAGKRRRPHLRAPMRLATLNPPLEPPPPPHSRYVGGNPPPQPLLLQSSPPPFVSASSASSAAAIAALDARSSSRSPEVASRLRARVVASGPSHVGGATTALSSSLPAPISDPDIAVYLHFGATRFALLGYVTIFAFGLCAAFGLCCACLLRSTGCVRPPLGKRLCLFERPSPCVKPPFAGSHASTSAHSPPTHSMVIDLCPGGSGAVPPAAFAVSANRRLRINQFGVGDGDGVTFGELFPMRRNSRSSVHEPAAEASASASYAPSPVTSAPLLAAPTAAPPSPRLARSLSAGAMNSSKQQQEVEGLLRSGKPALSVSESKRVADFLTRHKDLLILCAKQTNDKGDHRDKR